MTVREYLAQIYYRRRASFIAGLGAGALAALVAFIMPSTYTSTAMVTVSTGETKRLSGSLLSLAESFGLGGAQAAFGPDYVAAVMTSAEVLARVARNQFPRDAYERLQPDGCGTAASACDLVGILGVGRQSSADSLEQTVRSLRKMVSTNVGSREGIITLTVNARTPSLAAAIAKTILVYTDSLNQRLQREAGRQQRTFAEERLRLAAAELAERERALQDFDAANRDFASSPSLRIRRARLERAVRLAETVYIQLRSAVEEAMLAEANDVSTISVVQEPSVPVRRSRPNRKLLVALGFLVGVLGWSAWQYARDIGAVFQVLLKPPQEGPIT